MEGQGREGGDRNGNGWPEIPLDWALMMTIGHLALTMIVDSCLLGA